MKGGQEPSVLIFLLTVKICFQVCSGGPVLNPTVGTNYCSQIWMANLPHRVFSGNFPYNRRCCVHSRHKSWIICFGASLARWRFSVLKGLHYFYASTCSIARRIPGMLWAERNTRCLGKAPRIWFISMIHSPQLISGIWELDSSYWHNSHTRLHARVSPVAAVSWKCPRDRYI